MHGHCPSDSGSGPAQHDWLLQTFVKARGTRPLTSCQGCIQQQSFTWVHQAGGCYPLTFLLEEKTKLSEIEMGQYELI